MGEDRTDAHSVGRDSDRLTIAEAATLLGVHKNTVRNRIKNGSYTAELVQTERGPTYLIKRESLLTNLTTNTLSSASQDIVSPQAMDFVQELLRPFVSELGEVREKLGAERVRRQMAEERVADLEAELVALNEVREPSETVEEASDRADPRSATTEAQDELVAERTHREMAEATLHDGMAEERHRREEAERERDELRRQLFALGQQRESTETVEEQQGRGEPRPDTPGPQEGVQRPWWRRVFGG